MDPLIAVAGYRTPGADGWNELLAAAPDTYIDALHRAGALEAVMLPVEIDEAEAARRLERFDGLLLLGGPDVSPALYGEDALPQVYGVDPVRDAFEVAMARAAARAGMPVLAVCRGMQLLNVALGGTLYQHIDALAGLGRHRVPDEPRWESHPVRLAPGSLLARAMGTEFAQSASAHHQAVRDLGRGLTPVAWADDGLVEAIELEGAPVIGVQWHPEETAAIDGRQQGLFDWLAEEARQRRGVATPAAV